MCEPLDLAIDVIQGEKALISVLGNIDIIYAQVKQSEITNPNLVPPSVKQIAKEAKEKEKAAKSMTAKEEKAAHKLSILTTMGTEDF